MNVVFYDFFFRKTPGQLIRRETVSVIVTLLKALEETSKTFQVD